MALALAYQSDSRTRSERCRDRLGSVIQIYQNGWPIADACYEPYGGIYTQWNMEGKTFTWLGGWGYRQTGVEWSSVYVRARHYSRGLSNWTSIDPLWPSEMAYGYVEGRVMTGVDYWGRRPCVRTKKGKTFVKIYCFDAGGRHIEPPTWSNSEDIGNQDDFCSGCSLVCSSSITVTVNYHMRTYAGAGSSVDVFEKRVDSGCPKDNPAVGAIATTILGFVPVFGKWITGAISIVGSASGLIGKPKPNPTIPPQAKKCNAKYGFTVQVTSVSFVDIYKCPEPKPSDPCQLYPPGTYSEPGAIIPKPGGGVIRQ